MHNELHGLSYYTFKFSMLYIITLINCLLSTSLTFLKPTGAVFNLSTSKSSTFAIKVFKLPRTLTNLAMPNLSTLTFKKINQI